MSWNAVEVMAEERNRFRDAEAGLRLAISAAAREGRERCREPRAHGVRGRVMSETSHRERSAAEPVANEQLDERVELRIKFWRSIRSMRRWCRRTSEAVR